ncbi:hypothetical protein V8F20_002136 [Naviculisporaceae sp. PSN 640]
MDRHAQSVSRIAASIQSYFATRSPYRIFHGSTNSTRPTRSSKTPQIDISVLKNVLSVEKSTKTCLVEPNVPMDKLVEATLRHGLVPPVVMEFPGITAGGGYAGTAGESSSFRHGFFDDTVRRVEMVLADGRVVDASKGEELFKGGAGAVGTLGVTTLLEVQLMEAKKFVKTRYRRTNSVAEAVQAVREETQKRENDYVDGILFSKDHGVIITGELTDEKPAETKPQTFSGPWDPWFYLHAKDKTSSAMTTRTGADGVPTDYIPLAEYFFRYDRGGFWVGHAAFEYFKGTVPFNKYTRWFLDDFLHTRMLYRALHASGESAKFMVQDIAMPFDTTEEFVNYTAEHTGIWPLWLCPLKRSPRPTFHPFTTSPKTGTQDEMMLNVGLWGWGPSNRAEFVKKNREVEQKVRELGGMKWLYAHTYYDQDEFWGMYGGREWYDMLRTKYKANHLPSVWDKVHVDVNKKEEKQSWVKRIWPVAGFYGIYKGIKSGDYWLHRNAEWKWKGEGKGK